MAAKEKPRKPQKIKARPGKPVWLDGKPYKVSRRVTITRVETKGRESC